MFWEADIRRAAYDPETITMLSTVLPAPTTIASTFNRTSSSASAEKSSNRPSAKRHLTTKSAPLCSPASYALRVHVERIDRVARRHEQPVAIAAAEADVGGALGQRYEADRLAGRIENLHAVERRAHAPATPQIAVDVDPKPVGRFFFFAVDEYAAIGELRSAVDHVEDVD